MRTSFVSKAELGISQGAVVRGLPHIGSPPGTGRAKSPVRKRFNQVYRGMSLMVFSCCSAGCGAMASPLHRRMATATPSFVAGSWHCQRLMFGQVVAQLHHCPGALSRLSSQWLNFTMLVQRMSEAQQTLLCSRDIFKPTLGLISCSRFSFSTRNMERISRACPFIQKNVGNTGSA